MLLNFNQAGYCTGVSELGTHANPDPEATPFRWKLEDGAVIDGFPGVEDEDIMPLYNQAMESSTLDELKAHKISLVKAAASGFIIELQWKVDRALERDALNGTTTVNDVYAQREAIRQASNAHEAKIMACTTEEALRELHPSKWWPAQ
jgi:hypothetical protein